MPRRSFLAPVTSRIADPTIDRLLRNHDERIRELVIESRTLRAVIDGCCGQEPVEIDIDAIVAQVIDEIGYDEEAIVDAVIDEIISGADLDDYVNDLIAAALADAFAAEGFIAITPVVFGCNNILTNSTAINWLGSSPAGGAGTTVAHTHAMYPVPADAAFIKGLYVVHQYATGGTATNVTYTVTLGDITSETPTSLSTVLGVGTGTGAVTSGFVSASEACTPFDIVRVRIQKAASTAPGIRATAVVYFANV